MKQKNLIKADFEALSDFRYRLRKFLRFSEQITRQHGVTSLQYLLLLHVKGAPGREWATIGELAERLQAHHHGTVALVSRCETAGLVIRRAGRSDGRAVEVHLTAEGTRLVGKLAAMHRDELINLQGIFRVPGADDFATP